jgi:hypothetical protein
MVDLPRLIHVVLGIVHHLKVLFVQMQGRIYGTSLKR